MKRDGPEQTNDDTGTRGERHAFGLAGAAPPGAEKPQRPRNGRAGQETGRPEPPFDLSALRDDPELDPFEIEFLPEFREGRRPRGPFVNSSGVVIGDHLYASPHSPLEQWSRDTDPAVMAGDEWVHPFKDIGFRSDENRALFERGEPPSRAGERLSPAGRRFGHPQEDAAYGAYATREDSE